MPALRPGHARPGRARLGPPRRAAGALGGAAGRGPGCAGRGAAPGARGRVPRAAAPAALLAQHRLLVSAARRKTGARAARPSRHHPAAPGPWASGAPLSPVERGLGFCVHGAQQSLLCEETGPGCSQLPPGSPQTESDLCAPAPRGVWRARGSPEGLEAWGQALGGHVAQITALCCRPEPSQPPRC